MKPLRATGRNETKTAATSASAIAQLLNDGEELKETIDERAASEKTLDRRAGSLAEKWGRSSLPLRILVRRRRRARRSSPIARDSLRTASAPSAHYAIRWFEQDTSHRIGRPVYAPPEAEFTSNALA